jgi:DNA-binding MarR family transcriptional regulator
MPSASPPRGPSDDEVADRVVRALRRQQAETDVYVTVAGRDNEMHRTDLNGLGLVMDWQGAGEHATPGRLSSALNLSAPATTAMIDRLERQGHVVRSQHPDDRRSVVVHVTDHALQTGAKMFGPVAVRVREVMDARSAEELRTIALFLEDVSDAIAAARRDVEEG